MARWEQIFTVAEGGCGAENATTAAAWCTLAAAAGVAAAAAAPAPAPASVSLNATSFTDGAIVLVALANSAPRTGDWVGLFAADDAPGAAPFKLLRAFGGGAFPGYNTTGTGAQPVQVWNVRVPLVLQLHAADPGGAAPPAGALLARSPVLAPADAGELARPRLGAAASSAGGGAPGLALTWTSDAVHSGACVRWGPAPGPPYPHEARVTAAVSVPRSSLWGPPANETGYFDLGVQLTATLPGAERLPAVYARAYDDRHPGGASWEAAFTPPPAPGAGGFPFVFTAFGDVGVGSLDGGTAPGEYGAAAALLPALLAAERARGSRFFLLYGDYSYAVGQLRAWDEYVGLASGWQAGLLGLTIPGNHEQLAGARNKAAGSWWQLYGDANDSGGEGGVVAAALFPPPAPASARAPWFAYAAGPVLALCLSSEHDFSAGSAQHAWLVGALAGVQRAATPWVVVALHRQPYGDSILVSPASPDPFQRAFAAHLEPLLVAAGVRLVLEGHAHRWERISATLNGTVVQASTPGVLNGSAVRVFDRPAAPVHYVAGTAGADSVKNDCRRYSQPPFNVNCSVPANSEALGYEHGVLRLTALSPSELLLEYVANANGTQPFAPAGRVLDRVLLRQ